MKKPKQRKQLVTIQIEDETLKLLDQVCEVVDRSRSVCLQFAAAELVGEILHGMTRSSFKRCYREITAAARRACYGICYGRHQNQTPQDRRKWLPFGGVSEGVFAGTTDCQQGICKCKMGQIKRLRVSDDKVKTPNYGSEG